MKIALIGYGKMGHMIEEIALSRGHQIVSIIDLNNTEDFDSDAFKSADVAIEFTSPTAAYGNYLCVRYNLPAKRLHLLEHQVQRRAKELLES